MAFKIVIIFIVGFMSQIESSTNSRKSRNLKTFSLEEIIPLTLDFYPDRVNLQWISDTEYIYKEPGIGWRKYNALTDVFSTILTDDKLHKLSNYTIATLFSDDGKYLLLASNLKNVYRYSTTAEYYVYNLEKKSLLNLSRGPLQVVVWGANHSLAYVQDNNVYYVPDATNTDVVATLTVDGVPGKVYYGAPDWIYEEEIFNAAEALWFSPRGTFLAVASFNDTNVESVIYPYYGDPLDVHNQYPEMVHFKYPKAGRTNPNVGLRVYKLDELHSEPWIIPAPVAVVGIDHILGSVDWASDTNVVVLWLNRRQNVGILVDCDLKKDKCSIVKEHREHNGWIDINQPLFDISGRKMVDIQPLFDGEQRFFHAAKYNFDTRTTEDLSPGNSTVTEVLGWNQKTDTVYYTVAPGHLPWLRQVWATSGGVVRCVSCKEPTCRYTSSTFSPDAKYAVIICSACNIPPRTFLYNSQEDSFKLIEDNFRLTDKLRQYDLPMTLFNVLTIAEDVMANVKLQLPPGIKDGEKYPMIVRVYAGPGKTRVKDSFDLEYYNMYLATNKSVIVAAIDVRGSGVMGVEAMHAVNNALGTVEISDTLATIRSLLSLYNFIDPERIGVWGWSYGGYATTMMLIQDDQKTITCGAAIAPATSWQYYDSIYTERYMDTPQNNPIGYKRSDLTRLAERLRGRKFLLVHGTGDDNVHFQHSAQLAKQLQHDDIDFEQMIYTDENHSLTGVRRHLYHTLDHFWTRCFK